MSNKARKDRLVSRRGQTVLSVKALLRVTGR